MERAELSAEDDGVGGSFRLGTLFNVAGTGRDPITGFGGQLRDIIVPKSSPELTLRLIRLPCFGIGRALDRMLENLLTRESRCSVSFLSRSFDNMFIFNHFEEKR